jgi:hypothetical protein
MERLLNSAKKNNLTQRNKAAKGITYLFAPSRLCERIKNHAKPASGRQAAKGIIFFLRFRENKRKLSRKVAKTQRCLFLCAFPSLCLCEKK